MHWRQPVTGTYKGYEILSMPPPSSGGTHVIEVLNILENQNLAAYGPLQPMSAHWTAAALQQAFADRAAYMGDPDFVPIPVEKLTSKNYAQEVVRKIPEKLARTSVEVKAGDLKSHESKDTTHFSIMDSEGNAIASTQTINGAMGSGIVVPGTGIVLNDQMDDFSAKPGSSNIYGAVGGLPNKIAPKKTPLSSMSPTIVLKDGKPVMAVGAPGGTRIISCVAETILNVLEYHLPLYESVGGIRFHHQWKPDEIDVDAPGFNPSTQKRLEKMGYKIKTAPNAVFCRVMAVTREADGLHGVSDPRDSGSALGE